MADWELKGNVALPVLDMQEDIVGEGGKGEPVVRKWNIGIFSHSNLDEVLKYYGAETLVLVGVTTNLVVHIGAVQATDQGYSVIVPKDAVTSSDKEAHEFSLTKVLPLVSLIATTREVLSKI